MKKISKKKACRNKINKRKKNSNRSIRNANKSKTSVKVLFQRPNTLKDYPDGYKGSFLGKEIYVSNSTVDCDLDGLENYLKCFNRLVLLRQLAVLSKQLFDNNSMQYQVDVSFNDYVVNDAVYYTIKYASDLVDRKMNQDELTYILKCCHKLRDDPSFFFDDSLATLLQYAYRQFMYQDRIFNQLARSYFIFSQLWQTIDEAKDLNIMDEIEKSLGLTYNEMLFFSIALFSNSDGYCFQYTEEDIKGFDLGRGVSISVESHKKFLDWCSLDFNLFCSEDNTIQSPLMVHPIIDTQLKPPHCDKNVYIVGSYYHLALKCTAGIFYLLSDRFNQGGGSNQFKVKYGYVFEAYIGQYLQHYFKTWTVSEEIEYGKQNIKTVDWIIFKNDQCILFEVKQSSITLKSKQIPNLDTIASDLKKNLVKAAKQLHRTKEAICSQNYPELKFLDRCTQFQHVIVTADPLHFANFIGKKLILAEFSEPISDFHIMSVYDFEYLVANQAAKENLFALLKDKQKNYREMDFKEFTLQKYPKGNVELDFLFASYNDLFIKIENE